VSSGEEENKSGGEVRRAEREMEEGQAPSVNKTKVSFSKESATKSNASQSKASLVYTNEGIKGQKEHVEVAFYNQTEEACPLSRNYPSMYTDLAKLVVDVECKDAQKEPKASLGQEGKQEAQEGTRESLERAFCKRGRMSRKLYSLLEGRKIQRKMMVVGKKVVRCYVTPWMKEVAQTIDQTMSMQSKQPGFLWR